VTSSATWMFFLFLGSFFVFHLNWGQCHKTDFYDIYHVSFRFQDWKSEKSTEGQYSENYGMHPGRMRTAINLVSEKIQRGFESSSERIKMIKKSFKSYSFNSSAAKGSGSRKKILDPQGPFLQKWNKIFVLSCVIAVSLDPLFFYVPVINDDEKCLDLDSRMEITAIILRSFTDIFYILHIFFQFRTGFIAPSSRVFGRGVLVEDAWAIAMRYLSSYFLIDILAVLPLPQVRETLSAGHDFPFLGLCLELVLRGFYSMLCLISVVDYSISNMG
jgi:cyclic nucleotide gated channel